MMDDKNVFWFKDKLKAEQYLINNARVLSVEDVLNNYYIGTDYQNNLKSLVIERLNLK